jgi:3-oxoacyl-[acyl-carrier protein] reductase
MVAQIEADLGPVGILVNNAGIASRGQAVADTDPAEMQRVVATHAFASHYLAKLVIPKMRTLGRGDIVMISSVATRSLGANGAPYNMAKAALEALAFTLAKEERPHGIRVNIVAPGLVETEMGRRLMRATAGVKDLRELDQVMPFGRVCQPEDVANVVRFFVSDQNSYLTGERIYCDGGGQTALRA